MTSSHMNIEKVFINTEPGHFKIWCYYTQDDGSLVNIISYRGMIGLPLDRLRIITKTIPSKNAKSYIRSKLTEKSRKGYKEISYRVYEKAIDGKISLWRMISRLEKGGEKDKVCESGFQNAQMSLF
jgi:hypothetical protein